MWFVIDEVYCVLFWGYDFRLDYKVLGLFWKNYLNVFIMALTATATMAVRIDVMKILKIVKMVKFFVVIFNCLNILFMVMFK